MAGVCGYLNVSHPLPQEKTITLLLWKMAIVDKVQYLVSTIFPKYCLSSVRLQEHI